jgi:single-strand DNA-binding protein
VTIDPLPLSSLQTKEGNVNVVGLIGNLATDIELRDVPPDKKVATFLLAVDRPGKDAGADFVSVSTWNRQAEVCDEYLSKGSQVAVEGRLRSRSWEDEDGKRRTAVEVVANRIDFLNTRTREESPFEAVAS